LSGHGETIFAVSLTPALTTLSVPSISTGLGNLPAILCIARKMMRNMRSLQSERDPSRCYTMRSLAKEGLFGKSHFFHLAGCGGVPSSGANCRGYEDVLGVGRSTKGCLTLESSRLLALLNSKIPVFPSPARASSKLRVCPAIWHAVSSGQKSEGQMGHPPEVFHLSRARWWTDLDMTRDPGTMLVPRPQVSSTMPPARRRGRQSAAETLRTLGVLLLADARDDDEELAALLILALSFRKPQTKRHRPRGPYTRKLRRLRSSLNCSWIS
jgi:hypothetical protein